jgi:hypothetical protein
VSQRLTPWFPARSRRVHHAQLGYQHAAGEEPVAVVNEDLPEQQSRSEPALPQPQEQVHRYEQPLQVLLLEQRLG